MQNPWIISVVAIIAFLFVYFLVVLALCRGKFVRIIVMKKVGLKILSDSVFADKMEKLIAAPKEPEKPPKLDGTPLRVLTLLQREGRLLDFLMEDIQGASDEEIGVGVREIHQQCQKALKDHLSLEPVMAEEEGNEVHVQVGFDPSAIQLIGNVSGEPPFKGRLVHAGWQVKDYELPKPAAGVDDLVIHPAEVEI